MLSMAALGKTQVLDAVGQHPKGPVVCTVAALSLQPPLVQPVRHMAPQLLRSLITMRYTAMNTFVLMQMSA